MHINFKEMVIAVIIRGSKLPEGRFKEFWQAISYKYYNPVYALNKIIRNTELLEDGSLFIELKDGTKFYGLQDKISYQPEIVYANANKISKIKDFRLFDGFFTTLTDHFIEESVESYHRFTQGDTIVHVGAYIGTLTVKAAKSVGEKGRVIAIEPNPDNLRFLRKNIELNQLKNVTIVPKGVWSKKDKLKLYLSKETLGHSIFGSWAGFDEFIEIETDRLDDILAELDIKKVDLLAMNVEGAEIEALKGMKETLKNTRNLVIDAHHIVDGQPTYKKLIPELKENGFEILRGGGGILAKRKSH